jgi:hypothetical protein
MKLITKTAAAIAILVLTGCSTVSNPRTEQAYLEASAADTASTALVLGSGAGYEANPIGFAGATAAKGALWLYAKDLPEEEREQVYQMGSSAFSGYSINNMLVLIGAPTPVSLVAGLIGALHLYFKDPQEKKTMIAAQEKAVVVLAGGENE